jgi:hypothetical protein
MGVTDERVVVGGVVGLGHGKQLFITLPGIQTQEVVPGFGGGDGTMEGRVASVVSVGALLKSAA